MTALPFLTSTLAFLLFGLATTRHHERHIGGRCPPRRAFAMRSAGWTLLAVGAALACARWGAVIGWIGWAGSVMIGAASAFLCLNFLRIPRTK